MSRIHVGATLLAVALLLFTIDRLIPARCVETPTHAECAQGLQPPWVWLFIPGLALAGLLLVASALRSRPAA